MKWFLSHVISLHRWCERWEIYFCCRKDAVFDVVTEQMPLLLAKMKLFICDVIPDCHMLGGRHNRTSYPQERIFPSKWNESSVMCDIFTSLMRKVRALIFLQAGSRTYSPNATAASQNDVIPDFLLIGGRRNRTMKPQERIFPSKWSESSVMGDIFKLLMKKATAFVHLQE